MKNFISDNKRPLLEIFLLIIMAAVFIWAQDILAGQFKQLDGILGIITNVLISRLGKASALVLGILAVIWFIRQFNKDAILFQKNIYHQYSYSWCYFCANVLGIKKCNLILMPIYLQFRVVIQQVFEEYPLDSNIFPQIDTEEINITTSNDEEFNEVNFIFEDTYRIDASQIPAEKRNLYTVKISRNHGTAGERHYSPSFISTIENEVRSLPNIKRANVFATTNPKNNIYISNGAFKSARRGNIEHLYVYQQERTGNRNFASKAHKIF